MKSLLDYDIDASHIKMRVSLLACMSVNFGSAFELSWAYLPLFDPVRKPHQIIVLGERKKRFSSMIQPQNRRNSTYRECWCDPLSPSRVSDFKKHFRPGRSFIEDWAIVVAHFPRATIRGERRVHLYVIDLEILKVV